MTLRQKVAFIVGAASCGVLLVVYLAARLILLDSYTHLEQNDTRRNLERVMNAQNEQVEDLVTTTTDWAHWDDMYAFAQDRNADFTAANLTDEVFANLGLNLMILADDAGQIVYSKAFDLGHQQEVGLPEGITPYLTPTGLLQVNGTLVSGREGIITLPAGPMVVAARPILTSTKEGPSRGTLIFGYRLDDIQIAGLAQSTRLALTTSALDDADLAADVQAARRSLSAAAPTTIRPLNQDTIAGYLLLTDIFGQPALILQANLPREIHTQGEASLTYFMVGMVVLALFAGAGILMLLERTVVANGQMGALLEHSSDVVILVRPDGTIRRVNPAYKRLCGDDNAAVAGRPFATLFDAELAAPLNTALRTVIDRREDHLIDVTARTRLGHEINASAALSPICGSSGKVSGVLCSLRDITPHKRVEVNLRATLAREMELSELKSRLIAVVSHELRTPLARIQLVDESLENYGSRMTEQQRREKLAQIRIGIQQMTDLIEDILTLNHTESGKLKLEPAFFDLVALSQAAIENIQTSVAHSHTFTFTHHPACTNVYLDQRLIRLIISNLLSNAVKYSPPNGTIYLDLQCDPNQTVVRVRDEGIGIPPEDQARLFEPFFRAHNVGMITGTGLGLAIVKQAVEMHGGSITFESHLGSGTTFALTFPQISPAAIPHPLTACDPAAR